MSTLERAFDTLRLQLADDLPEPVREYRFDDNRKWRFDFAFVDARVSVELEGGVWARGRHTRGRGFIGDCDKYNAAAASGWLVLRFTADHLHNDPIEVFGLIRRTLALREATHE